MFFVYCHAVSISSLSLFASSLPLFVPCMGLFYGCFWLVYPKKEVVLLIFGVLDLKLLFLNLICGVIGFCGSCSVKKLFQLGFFGGVAGGT